MSVDLNVELATLRQLELNSKVDLTRYRAENSDDCVSTIIPSMVEWLSDTLRTSYESIPGFNALRQGAGFGGHRHFWLTTCMAQWHVIDLQLSTLVCEVP